MGKHKNKNENNAYVFVRKGKFKVLFSSESSYQKSVNLNKIGWKSYMCIDAQEFLEYLFNNPENATKDLKEYVDNMNLFSKK